MAIPVPSNIKKFAEEDIGKALERIRDRYRIEIECNNLTYDTDPMEEELKANGGNYDTALNVVVTAELHSGDNFSDVSTYSWEYFIGDGETVWDGIRELTDGIAKQLRKDGYIQSSMKIRKSKILAADEMMTFDDTPDGGAETGVDNQLDEMANDIEDMKSTLQQIAEDDPNISTDNNIVDHYIAECDKCHGIFISALTETEQEVQSLTGTCPLCGKESEQFLKWIIRAANEEVFEDMVIDEEAL